ncbi:MAG: DeoR/GlpR family DNA-binding transcription regulator [Sphaerochaetaceae bacterium]|jgi:DeoR/GlpR family transcriptional regulator of sugar metabolism
MKSKLNARRREIVEILGRENVVRVAQLSQYFGTSEVTIRSDLMELEQIGVLERIPGGALQTLKNYYTMDYHQRKAQNIDEKKRIAEVATSLVKDGETLLISAGTTTYYLALELKKLTNLKILTNSVSVATELGYNPTFKIVLLGGSFNSQYLFTYGDDAVEQLRGYRADKLFLSVDGVNVDSGLSTYHAEESGLVKLMLERSSTKIVIADHSKVGRESYSRLGSLEHIDYFITDKKSDAQLLKEIRSAGVEVLQK